MSQSELLRQSPAEAQRDWAAHRADEKDHDCPHEEHDGGICLSCGKDIWEVLVDRAEYAKDAREDR